MYFLVTHRCALKLSSNLGLEHKATGSICNSRNVFVFFFFFFKGINTVGPLHVLCMIFLCVLIMRSILGHPLPFFE